MEILSGVFDEYEKDEFGEDKLKEEYHIFLMNGVVIIPGKFRPKYMRILRQLLRGIKYTNIKIGNPWQ